MQVDLEYMPHGKQRLFHSSKALYTLFGGAKGGGKSIALVTECIQLCLDFAMNRGFLARKTYADFKISTMLTLETYLDMRLIHKHSKADKKYTFKNGSVLYYGGLDEESNKSKLNSAEFGFFAVDQAEEIDADDFVKLGGTLRLKRKDGKRPHYKGLLSANPSPGWLKQTFITSPTKRHAFIQALPSDNPHLEKSYIDRLKELYRNRPDLLKAYIHGSWDELEGSDTIIPLQKIYDSTRRKVLDKTMLHKLVACDPSTSQGENETVIYSFENGHITGKMIFAKRTFTEVAAILSGFRKRTDSDLIVFDAGGIGIGLREELDKLEEDYIPVNSAEKSRFPKRFKNIKAEMWWNAFDMFCDGLVMMEEEDPIVINQLSGVKYKLDSKPIQVEDKKVSIKRLGSSPDRADTVVLGLYGLQFCPDREGPSIRKQEKEHWIDRLIDKYERGNPSELTFMSA